MENRHPTFWQVAWKQFRKHPLGYWSLWVVGIFCCMAIFAPFLASSKPLLVKYDGEFYFPLFRYLFFKGFYTKSLDQFYNLLIFTFPLFLLAWFVLKPYPQQRKITLWVIVALQFMIFGYLAFRQQKDPASDPALNVAKHHALEDRQKGKSPLMSWKEELNYLTPYAKLNMILRYQLRKAHHDHLKIYEEAYSADPTHRGQKDVHIPTLGEQELYHEKESIKRQQEILDRYQDKQTDPAYQKAMAQMKYIQEKRQWVEEQANHLSFEVMPLLRHFHWEDDAGGDQTLNRYVNWWDLTRINRKDMVASLIFGVRISLSVGLLAIGLALLIGIPIGAISGYYGGRIDIITYRLIEIWESMPTFFMLLLVVAFLQSKSIFLVIAVIGLFGWTGFSRFVRGEVFRQKQLPYVEACHALGYNDTRIMFSHLLPNAIPPLLTLVPFAIMGAMTSEAGLSFLGLGEEGSSSWGVLMDEGRTAFPSESYLLWPPAILLTLLLVSIALVGDALRDALDPKLHT
jgi:peptide/nickel transport system permease protein